MIIHIHPSTRTWHVSTPSTLTCIYTPICFCLLNLQLIGQGRATGCHEPNLHHQLSTVQIAQVLTWLHMRHCLTCACSFKSDCFVNTEVNTVCHCFRWTMVSWAEPNDTWKSERLYYLANRLTIGWVKYCTKEHYSTHVWQVISVTNLICILNGRHQDILWLDF